MDEEIDKLYEESFNSVEAREKKLYDNELDKIEANELATKIYKKNLKLLGRLLKNLPKTDRKSMDTALADFATGEISKKKYKSRTREVSAKETIAISAVRRKLKPRYKLDKSLCITMVKFVREYLGNKVNPTRWEHYNLKQLQCQYVVGISNEFATKNIGYAKKRYMLFVLDCKNNLATYINPQILKEYVHSADYDVPQVAGEVEAKKRFHDFLVDAEKDKKVENMRQKILTNRYGRRG